MVNNKTAVNADLTGILEAIQIVKKDEEIFAAALKECSKLKEDFRNSRKESDPLIFPSSDGIFTSFNYFTSLFTDYTMESLKDSNYPKAYVVIDGVKIYASIPEAILKGRDK